MILFIYMLTLLKKKLVNLKLVIEWSEWLVIIHEVKNCYYYLYFVMWFLFQSNEWWEVLMKGWHC